MPLAWYNENDAYCAQWLRNLIHEKLIAPGDVDDRSIEDVRPVDLKPYTQCHFFAGLGGWSRALRLAAWPDDREVWTGSCPCQPFSAAGKRGGFADERHLWPAWHWLIEQCRPAVVFGEQVARAADWLKLVRGDLEALDYTVGAMPVEAASTGADQLRDRFWFMADSQEFSERESQYANGAVARQDSWAYAGGLMRVNLGGGGGARLALGSIAEDERGYIRQEGTPACAAGAGSDDLALPDFFFFEGDGHLQRGGEQRWAGGAAQACTGDFEWVLGADGKARRVKPGIRLLAHGIPARVAKLRALGNAIVPQCAAEFVKSYLDCAP